MYNFDNTPDRTKTYAFKWERYKGRDIIPAWVADTEFECASSITEALLERTKHGVFGYVLPKEYTPAITAVQRWCDKQYGWQVDPEWIVWTPGVVPAFNMAIQAFTQSNDAVIVQSPNYPPLLAAPLINHRTRYLVDSVYVNGKWSIDFDALESYAQKPETKLFILCNPMNPNGGVLNQSELEKIADICRKHDVKVCSDEIHCDLILDGSTHLPISKLPELKDHSVTLMAASKTFNIAGLGTSFAIVPDKQMRDRFVRGGAGIVPWVTIMGLVATEQAFTQCDEWYQQQLAYLKTNRDLLVNRVNDITGLSCISPQATYLLWVDASGLGVENTQEWAERKGVGPSPGKDFGSPTHFRLNYGCNRQMILDIASRLSKT